MIGKKIGRWYIDSEGIPYITPSTGWEHPRYNCTCECGNKRLVRKSTLISGESRSCGCLANDEASLRLLSHGLSRHPLYSVWYGMVRRCEDTSRKDYKHYGGRGISVSAEWQGEDGLRRFIFDMYPTFKEGLEIDRKDVDGNYCKDNCTWVTRREQVINRRNFGSLFDTHYLVFNEKRLCISQWSDEVGINRAIITDRIGKLKWSVEAALTTPVRARQILCVFQGKEYKLEDILNHPPHLSMKAKKLSKSSYQLLADILPKFCTVKYLCNKQWYIVEKTEDVFNKDLVLKPSFIELINRYGVQYE